MATKAANKASAAYTDGFDVGRGYLARSKIVTLSAAYYVSTALGLFDIGGYLDAVGNVAASAGKDVAATVAAANRDFKAGLTAAAIERGATT